MPAMSRPEIDEFLRETRIGVLCTNDLDGAPNGVPVWFGRDANGHPSSNCDALAYGQGELHDVHAPEGVACGKGGT